ncbi:MAG: type VI secretion system tip protein VgrG, partial [Burkholderiaceae bacterium]|nr:type VI secretion system tip protein VgrG [Burkholderiaceae bacterium]
MILADASSAIPACAGKSSVPYRPSAGSNDGDDIASWQQSMTVTPVKVSLDNFDFEQPTSRLIASSPTVATAGRQSALDLYDYPGGHSNVSVGSNYAKLRMQEWEARQVRIVGDGTCRTLAAGRSFTLTQHFRNDFNAEYLLLSVRHEAVNNLPWSGGDGHYENHFTCQPKATTYRPPRETPRPIMYGTQTAIVVGPVGEEVYTDKYGRVKVQFHWDRAGQSNDQSSCWIRVSQSWAGVNWGTLHIPRVGQEVIVDFMEGDPDRPIVTGQIYNAHKMPPFALPANKTQTGIKSHSTPGGTGENFNELRFEDKKDAEDIYFQAEKDFHRLVKNDDDLKVGHDQTVEIKNDHTETVTEGNSQYTITKGTYTLAVEGDTTTEVKTGKHALLVNTGDVEQTVKQGHRKVDIAVGNDTLVIQNGNQITAIEAGKSATQAKQSIELKVGGSSILLDSSGVTIKGATVVVEGTNSAEVKAATVKVDGSNGISVNSSGGDVSASGLNVALQGKVGATLKGNASTEVASSGQTTIKGTVVMIN